MKALVIDEPWIGEILRGEKTWERRKTTCHIRGRIGLIRKGSGCVVGTAEVVDSLSPITAATVYAEAERFHGIPPERQGRALADGWTTPWVLASATPLPELVPYAHPLGAVVWVNLDESVAAAVNALRSAGAPIADSAPMVIPSKEGIYDARAVDARFLDGGTRQVVVTGGNIRNNHIYLPLDFFPDDAIGGSNKASAAARTITVTFQPGATVQTDLDGTKRILRARGPVGDFLARAGVEDGDAVLITRTAPYAYTFTKAS